jgi:signal transduction histidine kinase
MGGVSRVLFRTDILFAQFYTAVALFCRSFRPKDVEFVKKKSSIGKADSDNQAFQLNVPIIQTDFAIRLLRIIILPLVVCLGATLPATAAAHAPLPSAPIVTRADVLRVQLAKSLETTVPADLLAVSQVPPGTEIGSNRVFSETYRWQVMGLGGVFLLQAIIISVLLLQRHRRRAAQFEALGQLTEIRTTRMGVLSTSIADELNQPLASILSNAEAAEMLLSASPPDTRQVKEILAEIQQADHRAADLIRQLRKLSARPAEAELQYFGVFSEVFDRSYTTEQQSTDHQLSIARTGVEAYGGRIWLENGAGGRTAFRFNSPLIKKHTL